MRRRVGSVNGSILITHRLKNLPTPDDPAAWTKVASQAVCVFNEQDAEVAAHTE
jgi:hypothetical protein